MTPKTRFSGGRRLFDPSIRIGVAAVLVLAGFAFLFIRLGYIQLGQFGGRMVTMKDRIWSSRYVYPQRGRILDRHGRVLAASFPVVSLYAHPHKVRDRKKLALLLARLELLGLEESLERLSESASFVWLSRGIEKDRWAQIRKEFEKMEGVGILPEYRRQYPLGAVGSNLIGFVGIDGLGLAGIEYSADRDLAGDVRHLKVELGDHGMPVIVDSEGRRNPVFRGMDVVLSVDAYLQEASDNILAETVEKYEAQAGSVVVMKARTGEILAMSSYPGYDPNRFSEYPPSRYLNQAINRVFEPGSTFKIVTVSSVISDHRASLKEHYVCDGHFEVPGTPYALRCYASHGEITYQRAVELSCNVGILQGALSLSKERFFGMIQNFGFGIETGIRLPGEERGLLRKPFQWSLLSRHAISIGQEVAVTNLQLAAAMTVIANGGNLLKPVVILETRRTDDRAGTDPPRVTPTVVRRVLSANVSALVRDLLESAVTAEDATGKKARLPDVRVAGKTGTAQVAKAGRGGYDPNRFVSSFDGFFPADHPEIVISVVVHEPNSRIGYFGGDVAAPAFARITQAARKLTAN